MSLEKIVDIEGLDGFQDHELTDDTHPEAVRIWFDVVAEEMPFLSRQKGEIVIKNFVHRFYEMELGRNSGHGRVNDDVVYDEAAQKWKVVSLAPAEQSHIRKNKAEWNAFMRGFSHQAIGTPLTMLFPHDPAKVAQFKRYNVETIEHLVALPDDDCGMLGMGALDARALGKKYLARAKEGAGGVKVNALIQDLEAKNATLERQLTDLNEKLMQLLKDKLDDEEQEAPKKKKKTEINAEA